MDSLRRAALGPNPAKRLRWALLATCVSGVAVASLVQCSSPPPRAYAPPEPMPPTAVSTFSLTPAQLAALKQQAAAGSGAAAYQLSIYYETVHHDPKEAMNWMKASAEDGDLGGMYGYATYLKASDDPADKAQARTWLRKVATQGDEMSKTLARKTLQEMDVEQKAGK